MPFSGSGAIVIDATTVSFLLMALAGGIVGVISGLAISLTFINFNQNYISRHSDLGELTVNIPLVISPRPPEANPFAPYMPLVLLSAIVIIVGLAFITLARSRKAKP